jgi:hypothetical protein
MIELEQIVKWLLLTILVVSSISLIVVFQSSYIYEEFVSRAALLAIVIGFSSIAFFAKVEPNGDIVSAEN